MPTFFEAVKRIIQGKPVYDASNETPISTEQPFNPEQQVGMNENEELGATPGQPVEAEHSPILKNDARTFPVACIRKTITRFNGPTMQVCCFIQNRFSEPLDLHKIELLGRELELKRPMQPNEEREFIVYEGPLVESPKEHQALLVYKTEKGDYFEAIHDIRFKFNYVAKTYYVDEINLRLPIKDIYG
jgi:hypothetical protein